jgi:hypothetical protein
MAEVQRHWYSKTIIEKSRDGENNTLRNTLKVITSEKVTFTWLETQSFFPKQNTEHFEEPGFFLDAWKPTHLQPCFWEIELEYVPFKAVQVDPDPVNRPPVITFSTSLIEQPASYTPDGKPIVNRAGEFITGVMQQIPIVEYKFLKYMAKDPKWIQTHLGAINSDWVKLRGIDWAPKTLLLSSAAGGEITITNRSQYTEISGTILADYRTWTQEVWNVGTVQLKKVKRLIKGVSKEIWIQVPILEGNPKKPVTEPVPIDEKGYQIVEPFPGGLVTETDQKFIRLKFDTQPIKAFSELPLK